MIFPDDFINKIICGDCLEVMEQIPSESIDLIVTSPPYNLKNSTGNGMKACLDTRLGAYETDQVRLQFKIKLRRLDFVATSLIKLRKNYDRKRKVFYVYYALLRKGYAKSIISSATTK